MKRSRFSEEQIIGILKDMRPAFRSPICAASTASATPASVQELTSNAILQWADDHEVVWHYIAPAKPVQNAIESFCGMSYSTRRYSARSRIHASRSKLGVPTTTLCALILGSDG